MKKYQKLNLPAVRKVLNIKILTTEFVPPQRDPERSGTEYTENFIQNIKIKMKNINNFLKIHDNPFGCHCESVVRQKVRRING